MQALLIDSLLVDPELLGPQAERAIEDAQNVGIFTQTDYDEVELGLASRDISALM